MKKGLIIALLVAITGSVFLVAHPAAAIDIFNRCTEANCTLVKENRLGADNSNMIWQVMRVVLTALGSVSVLMIVIGGVRFVVSQGDAAGVGTAKKTILYAVIGLVVALLGGGIVQMVTGQFLSK